MPQLPPASRWTRYFVCRSERARTTWTFRLGVLALLVLASWLTKGWWTEAIGRSLVCEETKLAASDAILVENFDPDYLLFERANRLRKAGLAPRVLVPIHVDRDGSTPNDVAVGIAEVMARIARTGAFDVVPVRDVEPITLNAVRDVRRFLERERIRSVIVVTPLFRSRRSSLVYGRVLADGGITVRFSPVQGSAGVTTWTRRWHGIEDVLQQWVKLQYYRLYVLPFAS